MKKNVLLTAPCLTTSGYGVHSRQIAKYLLNRHKKGDINLFIKTVPWGNTPWLLDSDNDNGFIGEIMRLTTDINVKPDVTIQNILPNEWKPIGKTNIGITAGIETTICNPDWISHVNSMSHVIVPSKFTKNVFTETSKRFNKNIETQIDVVYESYNEHITKTNDKLDFKIDTSFNFLVFGQITARSVTADRKNTFNTIKWLCDEFKDDSDVGIIIKTNSGRQSLIDKLVTSSIINKLLKEIRKSQFPKVHLLHGPMSDKHVAMLYKEQSIKGLISATRGEGFGLPILEAATSGLPVIATSWSGHLDFMELGKYIKLDYELRDVTNQRIDNKLFIKGSQWAEVKESDFKKKVRKFKENSKLPKEWAAELSKKLIEKFSFDSVSKQYDEVLNKYL